MQLNSDYLLINHLSETIKSILSKYDPHILNINPIYDDARIGEIKHSIANIEKANILLGYSPTYSFYEGLCATIDWYWNNRII